MDEEEGGKTKYLNSNKPNSNIPYNVVGLGDRKKAAIVISFHEIVTKGFPFHSWKPTSFIQ